MSKIHLNIFPKSQLKIWKHFQKDPSSLSKNGFFLAGGTALALQIGHRQSVDFDFFSCSKDAGILIYEWLETLPSFVLRDRDANTVHGEIEGVKVSFIGGYKYPNVSPLVKFDGVLLASILDIGLMKLLALTHRATLRDYLDLAAIFQGPIALRELLEAVPQKYGKSFNSMTVLRALVSFDDIDQEVPSLLDKKLIRSWQKTLKKSVRDVSR